MLTNSRDIVRRLEREGATLVRITGSHHHFWHPVSKRIVTVPHPRRDIPIGTLHAIYKQANWPRR